MHIHTCTYTVASRTHTTSVTYQEDQCVGYMYLLSKIPSNIKNNKFLKNIIYFVFEITICYLKLCEIPDS